MAFIYNKEYKTYINILFESPLIEAQKERKLGLELATNEPFSVSQKMTDAINYSLKQTPV